MKIEITCPECNSRMRLAAENAGKQARCPVCATITQIPLDAKQVDPDSSNEPPSDSDSSSSESQRFKKRAVTDSFFEEPEPQFGSSSSPSYRPNSWQSETVLGLEANIFKSLILGITSIVSNFVCCGPHVGIVAAGLGFMYVFVSRSSLKQSGIVLNLIGFMINLVLLIWRSL